MLGIRRYKKDALKKIRDFILENRVMSQFFIATPYPGTKFYDDLNAKGRIRQEIGWEYYNAFNMVFDSGMDPDRIATDLCWLYEEAWSEENIGKISKYNMEIWSRIDAA